MFEAGLDDVLLVGGSEVATSDAARMTAVGLIGLSGVAAFAISAWRERQMVERVIVMAK